MTGWIERGARRERRGQGARPAQKRRQKEEKKKKKKKKKKKRRRRRPRWCTGENQGTRERG